MNPRAVVLPSSCPRRDGRAVLTFCHAGNTIQGVETVTLKLERRHIEMLKRRAKTLGRSQGAVMRELIEEHLGEKRKRLSLHDRARDLCGSVSLGRDASTRKLTGYGRD